MHWIALFFQVGGYHAARLKAAAQLAPDADSKITALQVVGKTEEHPWGNLPGGLPTFKLSTLFENEKARRCQGRLGQWRVCWKALEKLNPDGVAIAGWSLSEAQAALAWCKLRKRPTFVMSESKADDTPRCAVREWLKKNLWIRYFGSGLVGGAAHASYLESLGIPKERVFLGYDAVDNAYFQKMSAQARSAWQGGMESSISGQPLPTRPYFLTVSRLVPRKNLALLIEAYSRYRSRAGKEAWPTWPLVICGSGPQETDLTAQIHGLSLESHVYLPGFDSYENMPLWYAGAGAFIHPALQEQWGLVVNEAMACGLPVLVSRASGCFPELVEEGRNGFGFDPQDTDALAALLERMSDPDTSRATMGEASWKKIQEFSPERFGKGFWSAAHAAAQQQTNSTSPS